MSTEIEILARKLYSENLLRGRMYDFADLLVRARLEASFAMDKHPRDLPEELRIFGNPHVEPRKRLVNPNLDRDVQRIAEKLHSKLQRPGVHCSLGSVEAHVRKVALNVLNTHPDDLHEEYRILGNWNVSRKPRYTNYALAEHCERFQVRLAPHGTDFMQVRTLVIAEPGRGWSQVRVLAIQENRALACGRSVEVLLPMTAPSVKALLEMAASMNLRVSGRRYSASRP